MIKQLLMHFGSAIVGLGLAYLVNQLPNVPDNLRSWVPFVMVPFVVLTVWFAVGQGSIGQRRKTKFKGNTLSGKNTKIRANDAEVTNNKLTGEGAEITTNDGTSGSGRNP
jgi:hypothetical protein